MKAASLSDTAALRALAAAGGGALCTIVGLDGSYSRRLGAQLAILPDGAMVGSLADGCLEAQLAREADEAAETGKARLVRFGAGAANIDFQVPCGSGLDVVVDPRPDFAAIQAAVAALDARIAACLPVPVPGEPQAFDRHYAPELRLVILGSGPECQMLCTLAEAFGIEPKWLRPRDRDGGELSLGGVPDTSLDNWTAVVVLFHDHEWERTLIPWALVSDSFYIGAQGGKQTREQRRGDLRDIGLPDERINRLRAPIGLLSSSRDPAVLALSVLAEVVGEYEKLVA